jgi:hypothetical protein
VRSVRVGTVLCSRVFSKNDATAAATVRQLRHSRKSWTSSGMTSSSTLTPRSARRYSMASGRAPRARRSENAV